jgi:putative DNA primase/helicase
LILQSEPGRKPLFVIGLTTMNTYANPTNPTGPRMSAAEAHRFYAGLAAKPKGAAASGNGQGQQISADDLAGMDARKRPAVGLVQASTVKPKAIDWLWKHWLARGKLHLLAGTAGDGKSTLAFDLAATITRGGKLPGGSTVKAGSVIIWSGEDDFADTILPRFLACGGDPTKLYCVGSVQDGEGKRAFDPAIDLPALAEQAAKVPDLALIIADPVVMMVTGDSHKNGEVRRGLQPLVDLAAARGACALGITHFRKDGKGSVLDQIVGSMAFTALARLVMVTAKGADANAPRVLVRAKSNVGPDGDGFLYTLPRVPVPGHPELEGQAVAWGAAVQGSAKDIIARQGSGERPADDVKRWLMKLLAKGPVPVRDIKERAQEAGREWGTVAYARREFGDLVTTDGDQFKGYTWSMKPGPVTEG